MAYVKIPDPNIIDVQAWHQVISVVNQHSDSITALTNEYGIAYSPVATNNGEYSVQYDNSSQKIIYGVCKINTDNSVNTGTYTESVSFASAFSSRPVVTVTVFTGNQSGAYTQLPDTIAAVYNVDNSGFNIKLRRVGATDGAAITAQGVFVNWIAVGPR